MLLVGVVRRPHGLAGEVSVDPMTDFPDRFVSGGEVQWSPAAAAAALPGAAETRRLTIRTARPHGERLLLSFEGFDGVDAARTLSGGELSVPDSEAAPPRADFYYSHQVEGWRCEDREGRLAGVVRTLEQTVAGPLLAIETPSGREALIPFVAPIIVSIDDAERRIVIDPPEGLLEV
ncbi:MAG: ribosome maturation factor RimM [Acidobacteriota bacterium]